MEVVGAATAASKAASAADLPNIAVTYGGFSVAASGAGVWIAGAAILALIAVRAFGRKG